MAKIPEGYLAESEQSHNFAVPSSVLFKTRNVHFKPFAEDAPPLDRDVELKLSHDDPRLNKILDQARSWGMQYGDPQSPDYIANDMAREKTLSNHIAKAVAEQYGKWGQVSGRAEENWAVRISRAQRYYGNVYTALDRLGNDAFAIELRDKEENTLTCIEQSAITSVALHVAGVENYQVTSAFNKAQESEKGFNTPEGGGMHCYVVTPHAIVEVDRKNFGKEPYLPILNGKGVKDVVSGGVIITEDNGASSQEVAQARGHGTKMLAGVYGGFERPNSNAWDEIIRAQEKELKNYYDQSLAPNKPQRLPVQCVPNGCIAAPNLPFSANCRRRGK